jgi:hypothetical protein
VKLEQFGDLLDIHGARLERWPAAEREAARALLAQAPAARALLAEAERLDVLMARLREDAPVGAAAARVMARLAALPPQSQPWLVRLRRALPETRALWPQVAAYAAVAGIGVLLGTSDLVPAAEPALGDVSALILNPDPGEPGFPL